MSKLKMSIFGLDFEYRNIRKSKIHPSVLQTLIPLPLILALWHSK